MRSLARRFVALVRGTLCKKYPNKIGFFRFSYASGLSAPGAMIESTMPCKIFLSAGHTTA